MAPKLKPTGAYHGMHALQPYILHRNYMFKIEQEQHTCVYADKTKDILVQSTINTDHLCRPWVDIANNLISAF